MKHSQCLDCGLGQLSKLPWVLQDNIWRELIADMGGGGNITFVYCDNGFRLRLKYERPDPENVRQSFVECMLASKWFFFECYGAMMREAWWEFESLQELRCCIEALDSERRAAMRHISLYVVDGGHLEHWSPDLFDVFHVDVLPALKCVAIVLRTLTKEQKDHATAVLTSVRARIKVDFEDEIRLAHEPSEFMAA